MQMILNLQCTECKRKNYTTSKNKSKNPDRITLSKYCRSCRRHTSHKEVKA